MAGTWGSRRTGPAPLEAQPDTADEDGLIRAVAAGDEAAFQDLVNLHLDAIHAYLYRLTGSRADAEDLAQETFLRVWRRASTYEPGRIRLTTWLHTIAHNLCIDSFRRQRRRDPGGADPQGAGTEADEATDPARQASTDELSDHLEQAIAALPDNQRSALLLCQVQGFSNAQAAHILDVNVRALESLLARARRTLRETLTRLGAEGAETEGR